MVSHVVDRIKLTIDNGGILLYPNQPVKVLVLGLSFKENVSDIRNSKSIELFLKLLDSGYDVYAHDPHINKDDLPLLIQDKFLDDLIGAGIFDVVLISVPHKFYKANLSSVLSLIDQTRKTILFDLRAIFRGSNKVFNNNLTYFTL
jgi:UDP-N-acetyl-D-galactosamine dehydrogenase